MGVPHVGFLTDSDGLEPKLYSRKLSGTVQDGWKLVEITCFGTVIQACFLFKKKLSMKTDEKTGQTLPKNADKI